MVTAGDQNLGSVPPKNIVAYRAWFGIDPPDQLRRWPPPMVHRRGCALEAIPDPLYPFRPGPSYDLTDLFLKGSTP